MPSSVIWMAPVPSAFMRQICDELGLSPFFFDLARDASAAGTLHDDTKLPSGDNENAVFSGTVELPSGMGPMIIGLVIDPVSPVVFAPGNVLHVTA